MALLLLATLLLILQTDGGTEYRRHLASARHPTRLDLQALTEAWSEQQLRTYFAGFPVHCEAYEGPLAVQRACAVHATSTNGVPTLYLSFFFANDRLDQAVINVPWWSLATAREHLVRTLGQPVARQSMPSHGVRLEGWALTRGAAVFLNRDRPRSPLEWKAIYWRSASACRREGCLGDPSARTRRRHSARTAQARDSFRALAAQCCRGGSISAAWSPHAQPGQPALGTRLPGPGLLRCAVGNRRQGMTRVALRALKT